MVRPLVAGALAALALVALPALALDPFEFQVYDAETLPPGEAMAELHGIFRPSVAGSGLGPNSGLLDPGLLHLTLEPQVGILPRVEIGAYLESSLWPDGSYQFEGGKLRAKVRVSTAAWPFEAALNVEVGRSSPLSGEPLWAGEIRPILFRRFGRCLAIVNPILGTAFQPLGAPTFEPAAKFNCELWGHTAPGLEYYTDLGPLPALAPLAEQQHLLVYTLDLYRWSKIELNFGLGEPLTRASGPWVVNTNLGLELP